MRNISDEIYRGNQTKYFVFNKFFFRKSCRLWDNAEEYCTDRQANGENLQGAAEKADGF